MPRFDGEWYCPLLKKEINNVDCLEVTSSAQGLLKKESLLVKFDVDNWVEICDRYPSEANLDKSSQGSSSYEFKTCEEEDFVNSVFNEVVNESSTKNSIWAATLSVCSSTAISRISKSAVAGGDPSWREILYSLYFNKRVKVYSII